ncbi:MBL fold metallo-hydrolase [Fusobacterium massiliense]|uniref:MBL fold metallo-hydrolase n=1 Tax=Fusobacterium massiliense TaxID=1852365 RepID=UPI00093CEDC1|nr:MBL fold metallo-hydrolase [Fusobacterium massiliense]
MSSIQKIEKIKYFSCGYCTNNLKKVFKGQPSKILDFYAGVFLIKHKEQGYILYDTGYSMEILRNKLKYLLYRFANPITLKREDIIDYQLERNGIKKEEIKYIIISHLHPDHIGGLKLFPDSKIIITKKCYLDYKKKKNSILIFDELLPKNFEKRLIVIDSFKNNECFKYKESSDLFNDGSMMIVEIDGHTKGQACLYFPESKLLIAADVSWGTNFLSLTEKMTWIARKIQNNFYEYKKGNELLREVIENGISVIVSHDEREKVIEILKKCMERYNAKNF